MKRMITYVIFIDGCPLLKIGRTQNIKQRLKSFETAVPFGVGLLHAFDGDIEKDLHLKFKDKRIKGEWFDVNAWEIKYFAENTLGVKEIRTNNLMSNHTVKQIRDKYNFRNMEIGDSFKIPDGCNMSTMSAITYQKSKSMGMKFRINKDENTVERLA